MRVLGNYSQWHWRGKAEVTKTHVGEDGSEPAPLDFPKMQSWGVWAQQIGKKGRGNRHLLTALYLAQGRLESMSWEHQAMVFKRTTEHLLGGDSPLPSIPVSFCFVKNPWHALNSQKSHHQCRRQQSMTFMQDSQPCHWGPILGSSCPFQDVLFPHKPLQQLLLPPPLPPTSATGKDAYSFFWRGLLGVFLVCMYLCVYRQFSMLCTHTVFAHRLILQNYQANASQLKVLCLQMPRSPH